MAEAEEPAEFSVSSGKTIPETVAFLAERMARNGYGILGTIDVQKTLKEKTGKDVGGMTVLDVCSPAHALEAIEKSDTGPLLLPCRLTLQQDGAKTKVSLLSPKLLVKMVGDISLENMASAVESELRMILSGLEEEV
ncbi:MAG: DUF302 domain-containing protein [Thermoplasmata archaeon]|uniref:DUF302 domain-containing protein n=1 Tax=Candidatus Sysuiplasma superficiale TaxID=2823368 RepID=A0A8J7YXR5_9ARCH|nr:DUF302 domain-containing protein [Candidatus Sysuiplasma superficiale]